MTLEIKNKPKVVLGTYMPMDDPPQILMEALSPFIGEVNNAVTRARIQMVLDRWNFVNRDNVTIDDLNLWQ